MIPIPIFMSSCGGGPTPALLVIFVGLVCALGGLLLLAVIPEMCKDFGSFGIEAVPLGLIVLLALVIALGLLVFGVWSLKIGVWAAFHGGWVK